jgi:hypothetical protein
VIGKLFGKSVSARRKEFDAQALGLLRGELFTWRHFFDVALERFGKDRAFGCTALDENAAHHLIFGAA